MLQSIPRRYLERTQATSNHKKEIITWENRDGIVVRALTSHQCGLTLGSIPRPGVMCVGCCYWFSSFLMRVFVQVLWFSPLYLKSTLQINSIFISEAFTKFNKLLELLRAMWASVNLVFSGIGYQNPRIRDQSNEITDKTQNLESKQDHCGAYLVATLYKGLQTKASKKQQYYS